MTNDESIPKPEIRTRGNGKKAGLLGIGHLDFGFPSSFVIRYSFIRRCKLACPQPAIPRDAHQAEEDRQSTHGAEDRRNSERVYQKVT